jgi:hypothetical protein
MVVLWFLLASGSAQVTYSDTPTREDLEQFFFGGMQILEIDVPSGEELRYQLIRMKDMSTLWSGETGNLEAVAPDGFTARFVLAVTDFFADNCGNTVDAPQTTDVKFELLYVRLSLEAEAKVLGRSGHGECIYYDLNFNWGHWTNILENYDEPLPTRGWIPAIAFIPNFNADEGLEYGSAETWLVLLVTFDDLNYGANPNELSQEEVINFLQDFGLDTTP